MAGSLPHLQGVLANVRRGRVAHLCLTREQKRVLRDPDGQIALDVLRHLLEARPMNPERFPLTEGAFQAVARRLGYIVGQKHCRRMVGRLVESGVIGRAGHYRQPYHNLPGRSGYRVALFKLARRLRALRPATRKRPVGTAAPVKRRSRPRWWQHPCSGTSQGFHHLDYLPAVRRR